MLPFLGVGHLRPEKEASAKKKKKKKKMHCENGPLVLPPPLGRKTSAEHTVAKSSYNVRRSSVRGWKEHFDKLTLCPRTMAGDPSPPVRYPVFSESGSYVRVPRSYGRAQFGAPKQDLTDPGARISAQFCGTLLPYQEQAVDRVCEALQAGGPQEAMLEAGCGCGKTVMSIAVAARMGVRTAVLVHKDFLAQQWKERINTFLPDATVGVVQRNRVESDADVVIFMIHSVVSGRYGSDVFAGLGLVVVDEAHHLCARTFSKSMTLFPGRYRLGLTATPDRRDGLGFALHYFLGPTVFKVTRAYADVDVRVVRYGAGNHREIFISGRPAFTQMVTRLVKDAKRTELIVDEIVALADAGRRIIVMSDRLHHLDVLMRLVQEQRSLVSCGKYVGETTKRGKRKRGKVQEEARVIFSTYRMGEEGLDIASLDALVLATPKRAVEQTVGRIMRAHPDKKKPLVVDILDPFSIFWGMHNARRRFYTESGFTMRPAK